MCLRVSRKREGRGSGVLYEPFSASCLCAFLADVAIELRSIPLPGRCPTLFSDPCKMSRSMSFQASLSPALCNASVIDTPTLLLEHLTSFFADAAIILCWCFLTCLGKASARLVQSFPPFQCSFPIRLISSLFSVLIHCPGAMLICPRPFFLPFSIFEPSLPREAAGYFTD